MATAAAGGKEKNAPLTQHTPEIRELSSEHAHTLGSLPVSPLSRPASGVAHLRVSGADLNSTPSLKGALRKPWWRERREPRAEGRETRRAAPKHTDSGADNSHWVRRVATCFPATMSSSRSNRLPDAPDLHPDIVVNYLQRLGVTPKTTEAIRNEV